MQAGLSTPIVIIIIVDLTTFGCFLLIAPISAIKISILWPKFLKKHLRLNFSPKEEEIITLLDTNPLGYQLKYKNQLDLLRVTGGIALVIALAAFFGLLRRFGLL